jgi:hypothetical protein
MIKVMFINNRYIGFFRFKSSSIYGFKFGLISSKESKIFYTILKVFESHIF